MSLVTWVFHFMFKKQYRHIRKPKSSFYSGTGVLQTTRKGRKNQRRYVLKWNKPWIWAHTAGALERVHTRASSTAINNVSIAFQILFGLSMDPHVKWQMIWTSSLHTAPVNVKPACKRSFVVSSVICIPLVKKPRNSQTQSVSLQLRPGLSFLCSTGQVWTTGIDGIGTRNCRPRVLQTVSRKQ